MPPKKVELKGKNILVTGGAGAIGSNLVDKLSEDNNVIVFDDLSSGQLSNLEKSVDRIKFIKGNILHKELLQEVVAQVEYVFHLAANVGNIKSIENPAFDMKVNIEGTLNVLEACRQANITRMVYSSSAAIFGEAKYLPVDEDHPLNPESPYAVSKLAAEKYCFAFYKVYGVPTTSIRYFNAYGPRLGSSGYPNVIPKFFGRIKEGKPLQVFGDGEQTRDYLYVSDIVQANILAAAQPAAVGQIFNIATGQGSSLNQLISIIDKMSGKKNEVIYADFRIGEVKHSRANIEKAKKILGYNPEVDLEKGITLTWQEEMAGKY